MLRVFFVVICFTFILLAELAEKIKIEALTKVKAVNKKIKKRIKKTCSNNIVYVNVCILLKYEIELTLVACPL